MRFSTPVHLAADDTQASPTLSTLTGQDLVDNERSRSHGNTRGVGQAKLVELVHSLPLSRVLDVRDRAILLIMAETARGRAEGCSHSLADDRPPAEVTARPGQGRDIQDEAVSERLRCR